MWYYFQERRVEMNLNKRVGVVGSRIFTNYTQMCSILDKFVSEGDWIISGGAVGADSMGQRYAKEHGLRILIIYPNYNHHGPGATFIRNKEIVEESTYVIAFYAKGKFQLGGTANTISWCQKLGIAFDEYEEE
jgi:predicted Rossmann fold nucleotide-binding protein DprA/Smf involved in DNA uptake